MSPHIVTAAQVSQNAQDYEDVYVHAIYDQIASHFSSTRYKPWPIIAQFLSSIPTGWVGLDSGTGNGKYLSLPLDRPSGSVWTIGLDRSRNLLEIARTSGEGALREVVWGDVLGYGWRSGVFDYAISIATIHHLATPSRRKLAVQRLLQAISPSHGRLLIYVWAVEQDELSKREIPRVTPRTGAASHGQDVFVPWVLSRQRADGTAESPEIFNRYYHMFERGELSELIVQTAADMGLEVSSYQNSSTSEGVEIIQDGWERSNYYVEVKRWKK